MQRLPHNKFTKMMYPDLSVELIDKVNEALDAPVKQYGPAHRAFFHDPYSASQVGMEVCRKMGEQPMKCVRAAQAHLMEDQLTDAMVMLPVDGGKSTMKKVFDAYWELFPPRMG